MLLLANKSKKRKIERIAKRRKNEKKRAYKKDGKN